MAWVPLIGNVIGFKAVWLSSVLGAAAGYWWLGPVALACFAALQLSLSSYRGEWLLIGSVGLLGLGVDSVYLGADLISFSSPGPLPSLAPPWIVAMWMNFALTLNHAMSWLRGRPLISVLVGLVGGPLAYMAGARLGAAALTDYWLGLAAIGVAWGVSVPLCIRLAEHFCAPRIATAS